MGSRVENPLEQVAESGSCQRRSSISPDERVVVVAAAQDRRVNHRPGTRASAHICWRWLDEGSRGGARRYQIHKHASASRTLCQAHTHTHTEDFNRVNGRRDWRNRSTWRATFNLVTQAARASNQFGFSSRTEPSRREPEEERARASTFSRHNNKLLPVLLAILEFTSPERSPTPAGHKQQVLAPT